MATETTDLATVHAALIQHLKSASAHLSNAAYYLEHPETYSDDEKTQRVAYSCAWTGLMLSDEFVREQIEQLPHS